MAVSLEAMAVAALAGTVEEMMTTEPRGREAAAPLSKRTSSAWAAFTTMSTCVQVVRLSSRGRNLEIRVRIVCRLQAGAPEVVPSNAIPFYWCP